MLIVTNAQRFPERWRSASGVEGRSVHASTSAGFLAHAKEPGVVFLVNCDCDLALSLAGHLALRREPRLVACDLVLRAPNSLKGEIATRIKARLLRRVDLFLNYFSDTDAISQFFPIDATNSQFIRFKPNLRDRNLAPSGDPGAYVFARGKSVRDYDTFGEALTTTELPATLGRPVWGDLQANGSKSDRLREAAPTNLTFVDDDLTPEREAQLFDGAKVVVVPILPETIVCAGISTVMNAFHMGKCVVISNGPGVADLGDAVVSVPPSDAGAMAAAIERVWTDDALRRRTAAAGAAYAEAAGVEADLYQRMIDAATSRAQPRSSAA